MENKNIALIILGIVVLGVLANSFVMTGDVVKSDGDTLWIKSGEPKVVTFNGVNYTVSVSRFNFYSLKDWSVNNFILTVERFGGTPLSKGPLYEGNSEFFGNLGLKVVQVRPEELWWTSTDVVKLEVFGSSLEEVNCSDSDGKDYENRGFVTYIEYNVKRTVEDFCETKSNNVGEQYCDENGKRQVDSYTCPNGCVDGACVGASVPTGEVTYQGVLEMLNKCSIHEAESSNSTFMSCDDICATDMDNKDICVGAKYLTFSAGVLTDLDTTSCEGALNIGDDRHKLQCTCCSAS